MNSRIQRFVVVLALVLVPQWVAAEDAVRAALGPPLQAAQQLIQQKQFDAALAKVNEAGQTPNLTAYESFVVEQLRGAAASGAGRTEIALRAYEKVLTAKRLPAAEQLQLTEAVATEYYRIRNYQKALEWLSQYRGGGGKNAQTLELIPQLYYLSNDFVQAAREVTALIAADEKAGRRPQKRQLELLASSAVKQDDMDAYAAALEKLVRHYPSPEYWQDLIQRTAARPGFSDRLQLDVYRLRHAAGTLATVTDYMEMAQLALQAGLPGEAQRIFSEGIEKGVLGQGAGLERQQRLKKLIDTKAAEDRKTIAQTVSEASAMPGGDGLVNTGLAYVTYGDAKRGLPLMAQGIRKGQLKNPGKSMLHLGYAYWLAGNRDKAGAAFATVKGDDGSGDLARLWTILAGG